MPTPLNPNEKAAFIAIVNAAPLPGGPLEASRLEDILNDYEDIFTAIAREKELFASNNAYLTTAISVFDDTELQNVGIWNNKTESSPPLSDPHLIINSTFDSVLITLHSPWVSTPAVAIMGNSYIKNITLLDYTNLVQLYIGPGCEVDLVDSSRTGCLINTIWLPYIKSNPSRLNGAIYGSQIQEVIIEDGSFFGGVLSDDPENTCDVGVTDLAVSNITFDSVTLTWTPPNQQSPPSKYLFIDIFYRKTGSSVWISVDASDGDYINDTGFAFRNLDKDTHYDFKVTTTCVNGGISAVTISNQTVCCGGGSNAPALLDCLINVYIKTSPDLTKYITLCNGVKIYQEYPTGTTLQIPYLANKNIIDNLVIDNGVYQNFPYDPLTGTWDAAASSLGTFIDGNVISIRAALPS